MQELIAIVIGTRPEAIKMVPVYLALKDAGHQVLLCSTMQHDQLLYDVFNLFAVVPDVEFGMMRPGQDLFYMTQLLLQKSKECFRFYKPSLVLVQGDTTSAMVAALSAYYLAIPVGHIEAGLRTYDISCPRPEEVNRRFITLLAQMHFAPTVYAAKNLVQEGVDRSSIHCTGNTVVDALRIIKERMKAGSIVVSSTLKASIKFAKDNGKLLLFTMHRRESLHNGAIDNVLKIVAQLCKENKQLYVFYPYHPNPYVVDAVQKAGLSLLDNCFLLEPLVYQEMIYLLDHADIVMTDSGGLQEEAISLEKQVLVLREKTERQEGIITQMATLVADDEQKIRTTINRLLRDHDQPVQKALYGDGHAAEKIVNILKERYVKEGCYMSNTLLEHNNMQQVSEINRIHKVVTVIGLGYIGLPTSILLAESGYTVWGYDIDEDRVAAINNGDPTMQEVDLFEKLQLVLQADLFKAMTTLQPSDYFIIAVPTPLYENKTANLSCVFHAAEAIASVIKEGDVVILESTVSVGTTERLADYFYERTGLKVGSDIYLSHAPERVLPGKIFKELVENDRIIGGIDPVSSEKTKQLYQSCVRGELLITDAKTAEMVKLIENSSRDVQLAFAHQIASMATSCGLNPYKVIALANKHPRVNILKPSAGVGGHCIAVDPWFLIEGFDKDSSLLRAAREINDMQPTKVFVHIQRAMNHWKQYNARTCNLLLMGLTYKPDVDDIRESPAMHIADMFKHDSSIILHVSDPYISYRKLYCLYEDAATDVMQGLVKADMVVFLVAHKRFTLIDKKLLHGKKILDFCGVFEEAEWEDGMPFVLKMPYLCDNDLTKQEIP